MKKVDMVAAVAANAEISKKAAAKAVDAVFEAIVAGLTDEGKVTVTGFGEYSDATGTMKDSLEYPLAQHISRLNVLRRKIPALAKGQYSTEDVNGNIAYKKRYTDLSNRIKEVSVDSFLEENNSMV